MPSTKLFNRDWKTKRSGVQDKQICTTKNFKTYRKRKGKLLPLSVRALTFKRQLPMLTIALQVLGLNWVDSNLAEARGKYSGGWNFLNPLFLKNLDPECFGPDQHFWQYVSYMFWTYT